MFYNTLKWSDELASISQSQANDLESGQIITSAPMDIAQFHPSSMYASADFSEPASTFDIHCFPNNSDDTNSPIDPFIADQAILPVPMESRNYTMNTSSSLQRLVKLNVHIHQHMKVLFSPRLKNSSSKRITLAGSTDGVNSEDNRLLGSASRLAVDQIFASVNGLSCHSTASKSCPMVQHGSEMGEATALLIISCFSQLLEAYNFIFTTIDRYIGV